MTRSGQLFDRARRVIPGGVHSPVRAFGHVGGSPVFIESADGAEITDVDGRSYIDFCMSFGPLILGHGDADVRAAIIEAVGKGWTFGAAERVSLELAELITANIDWIDSVRFVNSGTEAVMSALRLARAATGRDKIVKFDGCYHGHADAMLIRAGSGLAGATRPDSAGVTENVSADTLIAPLNDASAIGAIFDAHAAQIAAVIIEPVPANYGLLPQTGEFLRAVATLCRQHGTLLIFDEVITGFRLGFGGFAGTSGIQPDIVTWGKIVGGGFPVGAFAARREIMDLLAPNGPVYQAGTLSANPVAMTAGLTTLKKLRDGSAYARLESLGRMLDAALGGIDGASLQRIGSIFWLAPIDAPRALRAAADIPGNIAHAFPGFFSKLLDAGIYLPPSPYEVGFLATVHEEPHIEKLRRAMT